MSSPKKSLPKSKPTITTIDVSDWSGTREIVLSNPGDEYEIYGKVLLDTDQKHELDLRIIHKAPHTKANTRIYGVLRGKSYVSISGTLVVTEQAPHTESFLTMKILLLDENSTAELVPNLEIHNNEVKCSHAATIAPPPEDQLFYLRARGLSESAAEELLTTAFLESIPGVKS